MTRIRSSGGGGGGLSETAADAIYLRLDASNDPVTGQLSIANGSGIDLSHTEGEKDDSEKYDITMSSVMNPGAASFYASWIDKVIASSDDFNDTWAATMFGTRIGATGAILRVGVIAGINPAADLKGHFLPRHAEIGGIAPIYDLGGPTTNTGVFHQWRDLYLYGDIVAQGVGTSQQGSNSEPFLATYFTQALANTAGPRTDLPGIRMLSDTGGDLFVGSDPQFPTFYVQKATKANSTVTDNSEDASNIYQGNWGSGSAPAWPFVEMQFGAGDGSVGGYVTLGEDDTTYIRDGAVSIGSFSGGGGGGGLILADRHTGTGAGMYLHFDETGGASGGGEFLLRTMSVSGAKPSAQVNTISFAGTRLTHVRPKIDVTVDLGDVTHRWKDIYISGDIIGGSVVAAQYAVQVDENTGSKLTYIGEAVPGSASSAAVWRIKRMDESGDPEIIITWADGDESFDNIYDNRASLSYS